MKSTDDNFISEGHFDVLLRHALLNDERMFNAKTFETMANHILAADYTDGANPATRNNSIVEKLVNDFKPRGNNFRLNIFLLSLFTAATIVMVIFFTSRNKPNPVVQNFIPVDEKQNPVEQNAPQVSLQQLTENPTPRTNPVMVALFDSTKGRESEQIDNTTTVTSPSTFTSLHIPEDNNFHYEDIPNLTAEEIKQTEKDKMKIMKDVVKKRVYTYIPSESTSVNGVIRTINHFSIKNAEITNFEYNTFLNDLLSQGRFDDYLLAKPVDGGWKACGIPEFEDCYAYNKTYNDFPAVNMTRKGAELYCEWMTTSMQEAITKKEIKWGDKTMPTFRLPFDVEWIYAARGCDTAIQYPWGKVVQGTQNVRGCYLCNFNYSISKDKLGPEGPSSGGSNKGCLSTKMSTRGVVTTAGRAIDTLVTAPVYSYNPNYIGLYCTLGNAAEMVWTWDLNNQQNHKGEARSMGGSWFSDVDNVKIEAPEQYVGVTDARAYIGFRIVMAQ